jgi:flagellar hook-length control protein FliK
MMKSETLSNKNGSPQGTAENPGGFLTEREMTGVPGQVGRQVLWSLNHREEKVRMALEPPELGTIYMEIKREEGRVRATVWTENAVTREILSSQQGQLHRLLKEDGFVLDRFDVFTGHQAGWFEGRKEETVGQDPWSGREPSEKEGRTPVPETPEAASLLFPSAGGRYGIDLFI